MDLSCRQLEYIQWEVFEVPTLRCCVTSATKSRRVRVAGMFGLLYHERNAPRNARTDVSAEAAVYVLPNGELLNYVDPRHNGFNKVQVRVRV